MSSNGAYGSIYFVVMLFFMMWFSTDMKLHSSTNKPCRAHKNIPVGPNSLESDYIILPATGSNKS